MITSNETIVHRCALTYIPHVSKMHVVYYIHLEYHIQPSTLQVKICVSNLLWGGGAAPLFLFRPNTYRGTCMSIEHSICALQGSRGI